MRSAIAVLGLLASTSLASAADLGGPSYDGSLKDGPALMAQPSWTGFYIGANAGYAWGSYDSFLPENLEKEAYVPPGGIRTDLNPDGWFGGGQIGFNFQHGSLVFGVEADWQGGDIEDSATSRHTHTLESGQPEFDVDNSMSIESFGTVRGRLGVVMGRVLPYVTGGFAWAKTDVDARLTYLVDTPVVFAGSDSATHTGWVVGGGVEIALDENWSIKGEYLYYDLGEENYTITYVGPWDGDTYSTDADLTMQTIRVGVNYKFNR
jgi:outer membrane immunogenic protein